jgi:hypothetical protein
MSALDSRPAGSALSYLIAFGVPALDAILRFYGDGLHRISTRRRP